MKKRILALSLSTVMALSALAGVLIAHKMTIGPAVEETAMVVDEEPSRAVLAANYTQEDFERVAKEAFDIINNIRKENGIEPLKWGDNWISNIRAEEITTDFSHDSASNQEHTLENCARTNSLNAQHVVDLWMNSAGHKRSLLEPYCKYAQLSVVEKNGRFYWVNDFYSSTLYNILDEEHREELKKQEAEKKNQPSSVATEVKQEEQKPVTEVKQEVKQEAKPEVKEEQKPVIIPEAKQEEIKPEVKEEQTPASKAVETTPTPAPSSAAAQETPQQEIKQESNTAQEEQGIDSLHYLGSGRNRIAITDEEYEQYRNTAIRWDEDLGNYVAIDLRNTEIEKSSNSDRNVSNSLRSSQSTTRSQSSVNDAPVNETNEFGERVLSRSTKTGSNGETITVEESVDAGGFHWHTETW